MSERTPIERLEERGVARVDADGAVAFTREGPPSVLFVPGDPARPEVTDVAVVLGELAARFSGLRFAVAPAGEEAALRERLGVTQFPVLLFARGGEVKQRLSRMQSWTTYAGAALALVEAGS